MKRTQKMERIDGELFRELTVNEARRAVAGVTSMASGAVTFRAGRLDGSGEVTIDF